MKDLIKKVVVIILTAEAKLLLKRKKPTIIAVTGSVGKTSTKDAIFSVLKDHVKARKNQKSLNTDIGVPLTILGLQNAWLSPFGWLKNVVEGLFIALSSKDYPHVLVLEAGVDRPGDMSKLTAWLKPDVVVLTRLPDVPSHVEYFSTPEAVVEEKLELVRSLKVDGILIYNNDDEKIRKAVENVRQQSFGYSRYSSSHFTASADKIIYDGSSPIGLEFHLTHLEETVLCRVKGSLGVQHTYNYTAAVAVGSLFGVSIANAAKSLNNHLPPAGRMRLLDGVKNIVLIDDSYNASPVACERAVQTLGEIVNVKRKIALLGDMLELGHYSVREHEKLGELVAKEADMLITIGVRSRKIADSAKENGLSGNFIFQYDDINKAVAELPELVKSGDIVLVKASQGIRAEKIVKNLMADPSKAGELLVRQDEGWKSL